MLYNSEHTQKSLMTDTETKTYKKQHTLISETQTQQEVTETTI